MRWIARRGAKRGFTVGLLLAAGAGSVSIPAAPGRKLEQLIDGQAGIARSRRCETCDAPAGGTLRRARLHWTAPVARRCGADGRIAGMGRRRSLPLRPEHHPAWQRWWPPICRGSGRRKSLVIAIASRTMPSCTGTVRERASGLFPARYRAAQCMYRRAPVLRQNAGIRAAISRKRGA